MRRILSIVLMVTILMQSLSQLIVWAGYEVNLNYISKELCVNKEVKDSCCHGKCYLKKEMQQTESREQSSSVKEKNEVVPGVITNPVKLVVFEQQEIKPVLINEPFEVSGYRSLFFTRLPSPDRLISGMVRFDNATCLCFPSSGMMINSSIY